MSAGEKREKPYEDKRRMRDAQETTEPPGGKAELFKEERVQEGEEPSIEKVEDKADDFCPVAIGREHRP